MKAFVTGGPAFAGRHMIQPLVVDGVEVRVLEGSVSGRPIAITNRSPGCCRCHVHRLAVAPRRVSRVRNATP